MEIKFPKSYPVLSATAFSFALESSILSTGGKSPHIACNLSELNIKSSGINLGKKRTLSLKNRRLLLDWEKRYAPQAPEDVPDERFVEACHRLLWAEYQLDILLQGDSYERGEVVSELTADGYIRKLQAHLREERYHEQPCLD